MLPFELRLHLRFKEDSRLILYTDIEGDPEELRLERVRRALDAKCPKLANWAPEGRTSILIIEADDIQHSNVFVVYEAVRGRYLSEVMTGYRCVGRDRRTPMERLDSQGARSSRGWRASEP